MRPQQQRPTTTITAWTFCQQTGRLFQTTVTLETWEVPGFREYGMTSGYNAEGQLIDIWYERDMCERFRDRYPIPPGRRVLGSF